MKKGSVVEKQFEYKGHDCICVFTCFGFRNGYVSVEDNSSVDYDDYEICCHGGLTYSGTLNEDFNPKKLNYIGFDCGHCNDGIDKLQAYKYGLVDEEMLEYMYENNCPVRSLEYVEEQCKFYCRSTGDIK